MSELATSEREIILYYNPEKPSSSKTLSYAKGQGYALRDVNIITNTFTALQLEELASKLSVTVEALVNKESLDFDKRFYDSILSDNDWIKVLQKNPKLIKEPIAIRGEHAIFIKTPSDLAHL